MAAKKISRLIKLRNGRIHEVRFSQPNTRLYLAKAAGVNTIRVHVSMYGWTAHNGGGRSYHNENPAVAFARAANDFWK